MKEARYKRPIFYYSTYLKYPENKNLRYIKWISDYLELEDEKGIAFKGPERSIWGNRKVLKLNFGDSYPTL